MKISKFTHCIKISDDCYALYNSLLMDVIYINNQERENIFGLKLEDQGEIYDLQKKGIYVKSEGVDERALERLLRRYNESIGRIHIMYLILTNECNLRCQYCFLENNPNYKKERKSMSTQVALMAIDKFGNYLDEQGIKDGLVLFYGGEPLINYDVLQKVVDYSKKFHNPIEFSLVTNGTLINQERADYLKENNVNIGISVDGIKEIHDSNRPFRVGGVGSYDAAENARELLQKNGNKYGLSITVSKEFIHYQDKILEWINEKKEKGVFYNLYHFSEKDEGWEQHVKDTTDFLIKSYEYFKDQPLADGRIQRQIDSIINNNFYVSDCGAIGCGQFTVMPNGDISICHSDSNTGKHIIGNIESLDINSIFLTNEGQRWIERAPLKNDECLKCEALFCCGGGCKVQAETLFGSRDSIDRSYCIYVKNILKWVLTRCSK